MMIALHCLLVAIVSLHYVESKQLLELEIVENPIVNISVLDRGGECVPGVKCLSQAEAGPFAPYFSSGDPCFELNKSRYCLISTAGRATSCNCANAACNCIGGGSTTTPPPPFCHKTDQCLTKAQVNNPMWDPLFSLGDPCFLYENKRKCFVKGGYLVDCDCSNSECGCKDLLKCDNTKSKTYDACDSSVYYSNHTLCKYQSIGSNCGDKICRLEFTSNEKKRLVDDHNNYRSRVANGQEPHQPEAANMNKVEWDDELAVVAQRYADQCIFGHDTVRYTSRFAKVGQNAYTGFSPYPLTTEFNVTDAVARWYSEVKDFPEANIEPYVDTESPVTGHYTQVVWAETKKIGCGISQFVNGDSHQTIIICNYGPAGNMEGGSMYKVGEPGSQCPGATDNGLCL